MLSCVHADELRVSLPSQLPHNATLRPHPPTLSSNSWSVPELSLTGDFIFCKEGQSHDAKISSFHYSVQLHVLPHGEGKTYSVRGNDYNNSQKIPQKRNTHMMVQSWEQMSFSFLSNDKVWTSLVKPCGSFSPFFLFFILFSFIKTIIDCALYWAR